MKKAIIVNYSCNYRLGLQVYDLYKSKYPDSFVAYIIREDLEDFVNVIADLDTNYKYVDAIHASKNCLRNISSHPPFDTGIDETIKFHKEEEIERYINEFNKV